jgi:hypothetical protein
LYQMAVICIFQMDIEYVYQPFPLQGPKTLPKFLVLKYYHLATLPSLHHIRLSRVIVLPRAHHEK